MTCSAAADEVWSETTDSAQANASQTAMPDTSEATSSATVRIASFGWALTCQVTGRRGRRSRAESGPVDRRVRPRGECGMHSRYLRGRHWESIAFATKAKTNAAGRARISAE
jgi:hypothetical protein